MNRNSLRKKACFSATSDFCNIVSDFSRVEDFFHVSYVRGYTDGTEICLTTHPELSIDFITLDFLRNFNFIHDVRNRCQPSYLTFSSATDSEKVVFDHAKNNYNIDDGLSIITNFQDYQEQFYVAYSGTCDKTANVLLNKLSLLQNYLFYFRCQAKNLIKDCEKDRVVLPGFNLKPFSDFSDQILHAENKYQNDRYYLTSESYLTKRELDVLNGLSDGKTLHQVAIDLHITLRTVKGHIKNIKNRTGKSNMFQLGGIFEKITLR